MDQPDLYTQAAHVIVAQNLGLRANQNLVVVADVDALSLVDVVAHAAAELDVEITAIYVPRQDQALFHEDDHLPPPLQIALQEADAIFSCLSADPAHLAYRSAVVRAVNSRRHRIAHAPGLTLEALPAAGAEPLQMLERCRMLARALAMGKKLELISYDSQGQAYSLTAETGGWDAPPGMSTGLIGDGEWANIPAGETFFVPRNGEGQVVITGSVPGHVIQGDEDLVLTFAGGRCTEIASRDGVTARRLYAEQFAAADAAGDRQWRNFAEVGFGVNPAIHALCGVELIDEKQAGTVHVALGRSDLLGGSVYSMIHCDLVVAAPTVRIDGKPILDRGRWTLVAQDWGMAPPDSGALADWWTGVAGVRRSGSRVQSLEGQLHRVWGTHSGRRATLPVGDEPTALLADRLYHLLPDGPGWISRETLLVEAHRAGLNTAYLPGLLRLMERYSLVRFDEGGRP